MVAGSEMTAAVASPALTRGRQRIVVAMSGGVDSSVVAALLAREGHEVVGITLQLYDHGRAAARQRSCCAGQDVYDAQRVADVLGIAHYVLDYEQRFRDSVIDSFAASYLAGETPIPCVTCNATVKFRDLLATARELGADRLATGHYVERREAPDTTGAGATLHRAVDPARDQSYFLFATTTEQLAFLSFPLGTMRKPEVRALAKELGVPVAEKADSQDICFVPSGRYTDVIARLRPGAMEPGDIVDEAGRVLGRHEGIANFTVGQRRGLGLATAEPLFVLRLDPARRQVVVGPRRALGVNRLRLRNVNWLGDPTDRPALAGPPLTLHARVRSSGALLAAKVWRDAAGEWHVDLASGVTTVACGQACVFYSDAAERARVLGGGYIAATSTIGV